MRRHWLARLLSACLAGWFSLSVGEPSFAHVCPMHGGATLSHAGMEGMPGMAPASGDHAQHEQSADHSRSPAGHAHHCNCISCCVGTGSSAMGTAPIAFAAHVTPGDVRTLPGDSETLRRSAPAHTLPPGTGPPRA